MTLKKSERGPVFIIGSGRSGTSVLTWALGQHPNILPLPETHWIARLSVRLRETYQFGSVHGRYSHLGALDWNEEQFFATFGNFIDNFIICTREPRREFIRKLAMKKLGISMNEVKIMEKKGQLSPDFDLVSSKKYQIERSLADPKQRWVDGTPENTFYMYSLSTLFPNAKFIHLLRKPNDVVSSFMNFSKAGNGGIDYSMEDAYSQWTRYVTYAVKGEKALGIGKVFRIQFEELISSPKKTLKKCFSFLNENFCEDCLLPMKEKINSSKENNILQAENLNNPYIKEANDFYNGIIKNPIPVNIEQEDLNDLRQHFFNYAKDINR